MADAEVIPIGTGGRPGRGTGSARPSHASRTLAGESARPQPRRRTPKPAEPDAATAEAPATGDIPVRETRRAPTTTRDRAPLGGVTPGELLAALQTGAAQVFGDDWEPRLAEFLAFLRRRLTGEYDVDQFGFDPEV